MGLSWLPLHLLPAQGSVVVAAAACIADLSLCWTLVYKVGVATLIAGGKVIRVLACIEDAEEVTVVVDVRSAHPLSLAFWYCSHLDSSCLHWVGRDW